MSTQTKFIDINITPCEYNVNIPANKICEMSNIHLINNDFMMIKPDTFRCIIDKSRTVTISGVSGKFFDKISMEISELIDIIDKDIVNIHFIGN